MKVVVIVKNGEGGNGVSQATRYVSRRERDEAREGAEPRKLFSEKDDSLSFHLANRVLGDGAAPKTNDILHLVISFEKEDDFNRLGADEESRQHSLRETMRGVMKKTADDLKAENLCWVAGIHRNTDNPHVHLLIHRDYKHRETGRIRQLKTLPKEMRVSWERTDDGKQIINSGSIRKTSEMILDQQIEKAERNSVPPTKTESIDAKDNREERRTLGRAMIAEEQIERLKQMRDNAVKFVEYRRYEFTDGRGQSRSISEMDLRQRAWAKADQILAFNSAALTSEERRQLRDEAFAAELTKSDELLNRIRSARVADQSSLEFRLERTYASSQRLIESTGAIRSRDEVTGNTVPTPILSRAELSQLQDRAIESGDVERIRRLEKIRAALASENGSPTRIDKEVGRLKALLFVAHSSLIVEQESAKRFEETKHIIRWEVDDRKKKADENLGAKRRSLAEIDRMLRWENDQAQFIGENRTHWDDARRSEARSRVEDLGLLRETLFDRIEARRAENSNKISNKSTVVATVPAMVAKEEERYRIDDKELPAPLFTEQDLKELDSHAMRRRDPCLYQTLIELEHSYDARTDPKSLSSSPQRLSRVIARGIITEIHLRESELSLTKFYESREQTDIIVNDDGGRKISIARLADFNSRSPIEQIFRPLGFNNDPQRETAAAVEAYEQRLIDQHKEASASHDLLREVAKDYGRKFSHIYPDRPIPKPHFTHSEISNLDLHAVREQAPELKEKYEQLYQEALQTDRAVKTQRMFVGKEANEIFRSASPNDLPYRNAEATLPSSPPSRSEPVHEMSFER